MTRTDVKVAVLSLVVFGGIFVVALVAWFATVPDAWTWKSVFAMVCAVLAFGAAALVWRAPKSTHVDLGIAVMVLSLARLGGPRDWTLMSLGLVAMTGLLLVPLVLAAKVPQRFSAAWRTGRLSVPRRSS
jgi:hypothetical protein